MFLRVSNRYAATNATVGSGNAVRFVRAIMGKEGVVNPYRGQLIRHRNGQISFFRVVFFVLPAGMNLFDRLTHVLFQW